MWKYSWRFSIGTKNRFVLFVALNIIANILILAQPLIIANIFNAVQFTESDPALLTHITKNLILFVIIQILFSFFHHTSRYLEIKNSFNVQRQYALAMFRKVLMLPLSWHKNHHSGDTIDKIKKARDHLEDFAGSIFMITERTVRFIGSLIILFIFDWRSALAIAIISIFVFWMVVIFDKYLVKYYMKIFNAQNYLAAGIHDYISNFVTVLTLRLRGRVNKEIDYRSKIGYPPTKQYAKLQEIKWAILGVLVAAATALAIGINAYVSYVATGVIVLGTLFALYGYLYNISAAFFTFAWRYSNIVRMDAAVQAAEVITDSYEDAQRPTEVAKMPENWKEIMINNFSFVYEDEENDRVHIDDVSLNIKKGARVALIGESGSGKSTVLTLLRGLYDAASAQVVVDGKEMEHGLAHIHALVTLMPQEPEIFNTSIEDNITMGVHTMKKNVAHAIDLARFTDVLKRLPQGLNSNIQEKGVNLSGGEKQRLALARGIVAAKDSDLILMDEPTSSVDSINEMEIYKNLFRYFKGRTIISSIHRLHLLREFDYVYMFADGKVIGEGSLDDLLKTNKRFLRLWKKYGVKS